MLGLKPYLPIGNAMGNQNVWKRPELSATTKGIVQNSFSAENQINFLYMHEEIHIFYAVRIVRAQVPPSGEETGRQLPAAIGISPIWHRTKKRCLFPGNVLGLQWLKSVDIHHQISEVYGENILSDGMVRKWVRALKDGRTNIHDEE
ncbi:hypothetical protein TNCV_525301 [Trichonephila clavipes]|nr:hypothetical protein TNCV_525301 [Trichonephila clavipes]